MKVKFSDKLVDYSVRQKKVLKLQQKEKFGMGTFQCHPTDNPFVTLTLPYYDRRGASLKAAQYLQDMNYTFKQIS